MFVDKVKIFVKSGKGGDGHVSFRREKYVPNGGPDGGDGGRGGHVIFEVDPGVNTLMAFRHNRHYKAENGESGGKKRCHGKDGQDLIIRVPQGTIIREAETGKVITDLHGIDQKEIVFSGGRGGRGNQHFATATRQAPRYSEKGQPGKEYWVILELKMIADVGLVGYPNVGKSTLLSMVSNAQPKIANYHFTTLAPNLGVISNSYGKHYVMADIPGLIEGASEGIGLGHSFLRHVERTKVLVHVVDVAGTEGRDPVEDIYTIQKEIKLYNPEILKNKPQLIAANKTDVGNYEENLAHLKAEFEPQGIEVIPISAAGNQNLQDLLKAIGLLLEKVPDHTIIFEPEFEENSEADDEPFTVTKAGEGYYVVEGRAIERMMGYTALDTEKGFAFFQKYLRDKGIIQALVDAGIEESDVVNIYDLEFEYFK
ncbi:GTPase CgtA [Sporanaerobium hydrogeniformans]|uniref:GTPase CgtA n=1 Tax=Sporanaerobium hydrogeniformans TaxID=3072179 RepID=A0AC61DFM8_9FIRM|nr:GTPase ObgE [Sporanaerobium hydrogeniformans]PHV71496.1 GTPase CgtA [Sporanaerobium hydrogeniformans]